MENDKEGDASSHCLHPPSQKPGRVAIWDFKKMVALADSLDSQI
jgi:hypothetical protein